MYTIYRNKRARMAVFLINPPFFSYAGCVTMIACFFFFFARIVMENLFVCCKKWAGA